MKAKIYVGAKKYALYIGRKIVQKTLEFLTLPARFVSKKVQDLKNYLIYGNSQQDGTPTPTAPVEVESVGDKQLLPYGYTQIEYLESTGTQYIDTGVKFNITHSYDLKLNTLSSSSAGIFGARTKVDAGMPNNDNISIFANVSGANTMYIDYDTRYTRSVNLNTDVEISIRPTEIIVDGVSAPTGTKKTINGIYNISLFGINTGGTTAIGKSRFYSFEIRDEQNKAVQSLIPAKRNSDNTLGMYDTVTDTFLTNAGTGDFVAGGEIEQGGYKIPVTVGGTTTNIYLDQPLRKIGDYTDYIDFEGQKVVRNVGSLLLNTVNFSYISGLKTFGSNAIVSTVANLPNVYCESYKWSDMISSTWLGTDKKIGVNVTSTGTPRTGNFGLKSLAIKDTDFTTQAELKNAIGNAKVYYALATPTEEQISLPPISLTQNTVTMNIDTTIQPSKLVITGDIDNE